MSGMIRSMKGKLENNGIVGLPLDEMLIEGDTYFASITVNRGEISIMHQERWHEYTGKFANFPLQNQSVKDFLTTFFATAVECTLDSDSSALNLGPLGSRLGGDGDQLELLYEEGIWKIRNMKEFKEDYYLREWSFLMDEDA